jgi:DNA excision repair protein ERCC-8
VWSISWSPDNEHQLFSGDASGEVRLWDVRRSGCRALLDFHQTSRPKHSINRQRIPQAAAAAGSSQPQPASTRNTPAKRRAANYSSGCSSAALQDNPLCDEDAAGGSSGQSARQAAHEGAVTGILATLDGLNLITAGSDSRVRLWDREYLHHQLVHYSDTWNRGACPKRLSSTPDGRHLFHPRGDDIQVGKHPANCYL